MSPESFKRKLTAILSADVKGYSRLMGENETETVKTLTSYRKIMSDLIQQHRGRVVDSPGDNILAEFGSVVDAVQCAVAAQNEFKARNVELPENRRMVFRIGVNLGDVIEEEGRIYGDGVNIAARLEALAEPGGICISKTAFDHIESKLPLGYQFLGEQTVKNIAKPVGAYKVLMEPRVLPAEEIKKAKEVPFWKRKPVLAGVVVVLIVIIGVAVWNFYPRTPKIEPASQDKMTLPLPEVPSIAVLPFVNMSEDPKQEFLCDGMTEEIITALSKVPRMFVIARNSAFTYKGKPVKVKQVSEELGVRYVLEGSIQRSGDRIRITAQLIDAIKGHHIWAERYERDLKDLFALQDEITIKVLDGVKVKLTSGGEVSISQKYAEKYYRGKQGLDCYLKLTEASGYLDRWNIEDTNLARRMIEEAIAMCPENPMGYIRLGAVYVRDYWLGNTKSPRETIEKGIEQVQKALAMDDSLADAHAVLCSLYIAKKEFDKAIAEGERAVALNPNSTSALLSYANSLTHAGRSEEAIPLFQKAVRLNPFGPSTLYRELGNALRWAGRYEEAVSAYKKAIQLAADNLLAHLGLAAAYGSLGHEKEARAEAAEVLRINPKFSLDEYAKTASFRDQAQKEKLFNALRKAGLPDKPPLPLPDKPSIAVLPFVNMSDDPQQEYFSDGMTEDLITDLSKISGLFVIARNSTFVYKGKPVKIRQVAEELGVRYVLEGSVRRAGDQVRINAQLIDSTAGQHLWAERYDGSMKDIFSLQDRINQKIVAALAVKLTAGEKTLVGQKGTHDPAAYEEFLRGREHYLRSTIEDYAKAEVCFKRAIELDPNYSQAKAALALFYYDVADQGPRRLNALNMNYEQARLRARQYLKAAMKEPTSTAYVVAGTMDLTLRQWDKAISQIEKALALDPNDPLCNVSLGIALIYSARPKEGMEYLKSAMKLDPLNPARYLEHIGLAHLCMGEWQEAATACEKAMELNPDIFRAATVLASAYAHMGRVEKAEAALQSFQARLGAMHAGRPYYWPFKDQRVDGSFFEGLIKAGVPNRSLSLDRMHVSKEDQLSRDDLMAFFYPSTTTGFTGSAYGGSFFFQEIAKDGTATLRPSGLGELDTGRSWLEDDTVCFQFQKAFSGMPYCSTIFRNPKGTPEAKNEYVGFNDVGWIRFSRAQER